MNIIAIHARSRDRVAAVRPSFECGLTPGCTGEMRLRHSTLTEGGAEPYAEDVQLKCDSCLTTQKHGIGITADVYDEELERRDGERIVNFATDWPSDEREQRLAALGYKEV